MKLFIKLTIVICLLQVFTPAFANNDIDVIKNRVLAEIMKTEVDDTEIETLITTLKEDGTWPGIDYKNVSREGFEHRFHHANMVSLARAYKSKTSKFHKKKKVIATINSALKNWVDNDYFCDNWWHNQIGTPYNMVNVMLLVGNKLDEELVEKLQPIIGRAHSEAGGARPGGDRIKICGIQAKNCLFLGDDKKFDEVVRIIEAEIKQSEWVGAKFGYSFRYIPSGFSNREMGGRGIMYDNSFHHRVDGVNNTLSYGLGYAAAFAEWAVYTADTEFQFSQERLEPLIDYFLDGICKTAVFGKYPDAGAKNRSISREGALKPYDATLPEKLLLTSDYRKDELEEIVEIRNNGIKPTLSHATYYWHSEHFTVQRPDWFTSVRLYSTRTHNMEQPYNSEGYYNHHRGDGTNHISVTADEYEAIATVMDYQKIPGTTVMQKPYMPENSEVRLQKLGIKDFVGAATDSKYGAVAFDFQSPHDPLVARKSWFFFDDEYVCLGAGISCKESELSVATTLNQCLLRSDVTVSIDGKNKTLEKGERQLEYVDWIYQDNVAYVFPKPTSVNIKNEEVKGSWWRINRQTDSPKDEIKLDVFKAWFDHGERASEETYEYIVVPATSPEKMKNNTIKEDIEILVNTPEVQAVRHDGIRMFQGVFYEAAEVEIINNLKVKCESPGVLIIQAMGDDGVRITASDPNREQAKMIVGVSADISGSGENFKTYRNDEEEMTYIIIDLPKGHFAGSSVTIEL